MHRPFERVFTVNDFWDAPRYGVAYLDGVPHLYDSRFDEEADDYSEIYELRLVDDETVALVLEDWDIWLRWLEAFHAGQTTHETHPALAPDRARHDELAPCVRERLASLAGPVTHARAVFRTADGAAASGHGRRLEVQWTMVP